MKNPTEEPTVRPNLNLLSVSLFLRLQSGIARRPVQSAASSIDRVRVIGHSIMKTCVVFITNRHPGDEGFPHFCNEPGQKPGRMPFHPDGAVING